MICKNCGSTVEDGVKFCTKCGERMDEVAEAVQETAEAVQETAEVAQETVEEEVKAEAPVEAAPASDDRYLRLMAEYDNFRKRSAKERENIYTDVPA